MRWKIILCVAAVAATTAGITLPKGDAAAEQPGQIATLELDE
jgi:hypothetical protein